MREPGVHGTALGVKAFIDCSCDLGGLGMTAIDKVTLAPMPRREPASCCAMSMYPVSVERTMHKGQAALVFCQSICRLRRPTAPSRPSPHIA